MKLFKPDRYVDFEKTIFEWCLEDLKSDYIGKNMSRQLIKPYIIVNS